MPRTKETPPPPLLTGTVRMIHLEKGFGFIRAADGNEYFFHRSSSEDFERLTLGTDVRFTALIGPKGPRAENVEIA